MMGDTSLSTVNRHYFNLDDEAMTKISEGWEAKKLASKKPRPDSSFAG